MILLALVVVALAAAVLAIPLSVFALPLAAAIWGGAALAGVDVSFFGIWGIVTAALVLLCPVPWD